MEIRRDKAFTLLEMLVVLTIIAILAGLTLPAFKGLRKANILDSALRQMLDDVSLARQYAISGRTTVHMVFVPPEVAVMSYRDAQGVPLAPTAPVRKLINRIANGAFRSYAIYAERTAGDQPGRPQDQYLTPWRLLPQGVILKTNEFMGAAAFNAVYATAAPAEDRPLQYAFLPFPASGVYPTVSGNPALIPHIAFDPQGRLMYTGGNDAFKNEVIDLIEGSVLTKRDDNDQLLFYDVRQLGTPNTNAFNRISIDAFTGRSRIWQPTIQ